MNWVINLTLDEGIVVIRCLSEMVAISAIKRLSQGGVRLVCTSSEGAELIRRKFERYVIDDEAPRERRRLRKPLG
jgi:hypothetical protein